MVKYHVMPDYVIRSKKNSLGTQNNKMRHKLYVKLANVGEHIIDRKTLEKVIHTCWAGVRQVQRVRQNSAPRFVMTRGLRKLPN